MSMKSELAELKEKLVALKERIEADDQEAIEEAIQLKADIESKTAEIEQAETKAELLDVIGEKSKKEDEKMENNEGIKGLDLLSIKEKRGAVSCYIKAYNSPNTGVQEADLDRNVVDVKKPLAIRSLFGAEQISGNALTYYTLGNLEDNNAIGETVAEGAQKHQIHVGQTGATVALIKKGVFVKETDELLNDNAWLESALRSRYIYEFDKMIEKYLVTTAAGTANIQGSTDGVTPDGILKAILAIKEQTGFDANAVILNPADLYTILAMKDQNNQYLFGGPAFAPYGNGAYSRVAQMWGVPMVPSSDVAQGTCLVGAFDRGASVVTKAGEGQRVEVSNSDQDDFVKNLVTVRIEERLVEVVRYPKAIYKLTTSTGG